MASLFKRKSGIYVVQYKDSRGKVITKSTRTRSKREARLFKKDIEVQLAKGLIRDLKHISLDLYYQEFLRDIEHLRSKTRISYECVTRKFVEFVGKKLISSITRNDIVCFLDLYSRHAPKTYNNVLITLKRFFRCALERGYLSHNPTDGIHPKKVPGTLPKFFTDEEYLRIEKTAVNTPIYPMIVTARYTGLRLGELLALEWQDFDWTRKLVRVINKPGHTIKNYQNRVVPISGELETKLKPYIESEGVCFLTHHGKRRGERYSSDGPKRQLRKIFKQAGITRDRRFGWHDFRHTFASRLVQEGVSIYKVCKWLGHANVSTTQIYAQFAPSYDEDIERLCLSTL